MKVIEQLDCDWSFRRCQEGSLGELVSLPHSPFVSDLDGNRHWFGVCEYRRLIKVDPSFAGQSIFLKVGAAMQHALIYLDDVLVGENRGGYLPFEIELTEGIRLGEAVTLRIELSNRWDAEIPPGKKFEELDFCWYGGLYRDAALVAYPKRRVISNLSGAESNGGVLVQTLEADEGAAKLRVSVWADLGEVNSEEKCGLSISISKWKSRHSDFEATYPASLLERTEEGCLAFEFEIPTPDLWSIQHPHLYVCHVKLVETHGEVVDSIESRFGIRRIDFSRSGGFELNGENLKLRGVNRHQEYPYVGYAVPPAAQYRDAIRIKEAGFDYVRLSHYPQSESFLDACDELGIVVMNCIPGWQYQGGEAFSFACEENARQLIRRDRNHPSVVLWELSLNETEMSEAFMEAMQRLGHEELPGDQMFTCGWVDDFDVFMRSRQHGSLREWRSGEKASVVAEYGDWEYYAYNEGFEQDQREGLMDPDFNSRKFRSDGARGMFQQAKNHMIAHNDIRNSPAAMDGLWAMFDHARGYHEQRAAVGVMDVFRLPKFSYHFYRSQRDPIEVGEGWDGGPVVFIASQLDEYRETHLWVYSNCDEIRLKVNGEFFATQRPTVNSITQYLARKPFIFELPGGTIDRIEAFGLIGGVEAARQLIERSGDAKRLEIEIDDLGVTLDWERSDLVFVRARLVDAKGVSCHENLGEVVFGLEGDGEFADGVGVAQVENGIASALVRVHRGASFLRISATKEGMPVVELSVLEAAEAAVDAPVGPA